jgi:AcrR family transcriptional regulator
MTDVRTPSNADGRRARSERSKAAVVDAMLGFARDGVYEPTSIEIAERAGITQRTLFRHFGTIDDIFVALVERQTDFVTPFLLPMDRTGTVGDRVHRLVDNRTELYMAIAPIRRAGLRIATQHEVISEALALMTARIHAQIEELFENDLTRVDRRTRQLVVDAIDTATSWEVWDRLHSVRRLGRARIAATMAQLVRTQLPS